MRTMLPCCVAFLLCSLSAPATAQEPTVRWSAERTMEEQGELERVICATDDAAYLLLHDVYWLNQGGTAPVSGSYFIEKLDLTGLLTEVRAEFTIKDHHDETILACFQLGDRIAIVTRRKEKKEYSAVLWQWKMADLSPVGSGTVLGTWTALSVVPPGFSIYTSPRAGKFLLWVSNYTNKSRTAYGFDGFVHDEHGKVIHKIHPTSLAPPVAFPMGWRTLVDDGTGSAEITVDDAGTVRMVMGDERYVTFTATDPGGDVVKLPAVPSGQLRTSRIMLSGEAQTPHVLQLYSDAVNGQLRSLQLATPGTSKTLAPLAEVTFSGEAADVPPVRMPVQGPVLKGYDLIARDGLVAMNPYYAGMEFFGDVIVLHGPQVEQAVQTAVRLPYFLGKALPAQEAALSKAYPGAISTPFRKRWVGMGNNGFCVLYNANNAEEDPEDLYLNQKHACLKASWGGSDNQVRTVELPAPVSDRASVYVPETTRLLRRGLALIATHDHRSMDSQMSKDLYHLGLVSF